MKSISHFLLCGALLATTPSRLLATAVAAGTEPTQLIHVATNNLGWIKSIAQEVQSYEVFIQQLMNQRNISGVLGLASDLQTVAELTNQITEAITDMPSTLGTDLLNLGVEAVDTYSNVVYTFKKGEQIYDQLNGKNVNPYARRRYGPNNRFRSGGDLYHQLSNLRSQMSSDFLSHSDSRSQQFSRWSRDLESENRSIVTNGNNAIKLQATQAKAAGTTNSILLTQAQMQARAEERAAVDQLTKEAEKAEQFEKDNAKRGTSGVHTSHIISNWGN